MFGDMFEVKKHVSYQYAAKNDQKVDTLSKILRQEQDRINRIRNIGEFEYGESKLDHKHKLEEQWKENRLKERQKQNKDYLQEQIKFKEQHAKFEKDIEQDLADKINKKAQEELEKETKKKQEAERRRAKKYKDELKTQINFKHEQHPTMTEQERLMNKEKLMNI